MLKDKIEVIGTSYKLEHWEKLVIERCVEDNPSFGQNELASMLGLSFRTLVRKLDQYQIDASPKRRKHLIKNLKIVYGK